MSPANKTVISFLTDPSKFFFFESNRVVNSGSSSALETIQTCYSGSCSATSVTLPIASTQVKTSLPKSSTGRTSEVDTTYNSSNGAVSEVDYYDFGAVGSGSPGSLLSKTTTSYAVYDRPNTVTTYNGSGTVVAQMSYVYSDTTSPTTGTPQHISVSAPRGNATSVTQWVSSGVNLVSTYSYFDTGMIETATDPNGSSATATYGECGNSFPTSISEPLSMSISATWDCHGGVLLSQTDENGAQTGYTYNDPSGMWRVTAANFPNGGQTSYTYNLASTPPNIQTSQKLNNSSSILLQTNYDGLGRDVRDENLSDPAPDYVDYVYDPRGLLFSVSNPYRTTSDPTYGVTKYYYDALGRPSQVLNPDNSSKNWSYTDAAVQFTDEGNGTRSVTQIQQLDGLGRATSVCEVTSVTQSGITPTPAACSLDIPGTGFLTTYGWDPLGNLTSVAQGGLNARSYVYDGLSRMTSATNPESGVTTYSYNANGDPYQRIRPKQNQTNGSVKVTTSYTFDTFHRITGISYNDGTTLPVTFNYDETSVLNLPVTNGKTRLTSEYVKNGATTVAGTGYSYDPVGHLWRRYQCTPTNCSGTAYSVAYTYDYLGDVTSYKDGAGNTFTPTYNAIGQMTQLTSSNNQPPNYPGTLWSSGNYNAFGAPISDTLGNGLAETFTYNNVLALTSYQAGTSVGPTFTQSLTYTPNGNVKTSNDTVNGNWQYTYDDFNRLLSSTGSSTSYSYGYDRFGNRWTQSGSAPNSSLSFDANNHLTVTGYHYDAMGNVTGDPTYTYSYDAEGRLIGVTNATTTVSYVYDAEGKKIESNISGSVLDYIRDAQGRELSAMNTSGQQTDGEIFANGFHLATYSNGQTYFRHADAALGTIRMLTNPSDTIASTCSTLPFGDGANCPFGVDTNVRFTDQEHTSESGLEHFLYRDYSSTQGRWMTPDPYFGSIVPSLPQSLNRYSYASNNPTTVVDLNGLYAPAPPSVGVGDDGCAYDGPFDSTGIPSWLFYWWYCGGVGGGWGGGGGGVTMGPGGYGSKGNPSPPLGGETLGVPNGLKLRPGSIWSIFLPIDPGCEFGNCTDLGNFAPGAQSIPWPQIAELGGLASRAAGLLGIVESLITLESDNTPCNQQDDGTWMCGGKRWTCHASCNVQPIGDTILRIDRVTGIGFGSNQNDACLAAKRMATQTSPPGSYPRHCKCFCSKT